MEAVPVRELGQLQKAFTTFNELSLGIGGQL